MKITELAIEFSGNLLTLTSERAIWWAEQRILILADLHLGKAAHFRKNGIPLPAAISVQDLQRLESLTNHFRAQQVLIAGDLIHAGSNTEVLLFRELAQKLQDTRFVLIRGNHDRVPDSDLRHIGLHAVHNELEIGGIRFTHDAAARSEIPTISGHIHPGINLDLPIRKSMRLPCYVVTQHQVILPAFSRFTGLSTSAAPPGAVCYALYGEKIFRIG